jgi:hypothetical protein
MSLRFRRNVSVFVPPSQAASHAEKVDGEPDAEQQFLELQTHLVVYELSPLHLRQLRKCASAGLFTEQPHVPSSPYADNT